MSAVSRLEPAALDAVLDAVLASNPNAPISAINATGFFLSQRAELEVALSAVLLEGEDRDVEVSLRRHGRPVPFSETPARGGHFRSVRRRPRVV